MVAAAHLKTLRESLGLTAQWLADQAGVRLRSVQYWESGRSKVPADVCNMLKNIDESLNGSVERAVEHINEVKAETGAYPEEVVLIRYRTDDDLWQFREDMRPLPTTTHAEMLARMRREFAKINVQTQIVYMDANAYLTWLGDRVDDEAARSEWALSL